MRSLTKSCVRLAWTAASLLALAALAFAPASARADMETFSVSGSGGDGALDATAVFNISPGQIVITLTNTLALANFRSVGQAISDISFTLSNPPGTLSSPTASGQQGNIDSSGVLTFVAGTPDSFLGMGSGSNSGSFSIVGDTITLEAIGGGKPTQLITPGGVANGGTFPDTNPGIDSHNPYTIGPATFTLPLSGVDVVAATTVVPDSVIFSFGTSPDTFLLSTPNGTVVVPAPPSIVFAVTAAICLGGFMALPRRRRKTAAA